MTNPTHTKKSEIASRVTPFSALRRLRYKRLLALALALIAAAGTLRADQVSPFTPGVQRFFPTNSTDFPTGTIGITSAVTGTTPLVFGSTQPNSLVGYVGYVLIGSLGGAGTTPSVNLYTGAGTSGQNTSADPSQLYAIRIVSRTTAQLFPTLADAMNQTNPISFTSASTTKTVVYNADSEWCWNACSQMLLGAAGVNTSQDSIADDAFTGPLAGHFYNDPNYITNQTYNLGGGLSEKGIAAIINDLGNIKATVAPQISATEIQAQVDANFPMVFEIGWYNNNVRVGGHFIAIYGIGSDLDTLNVANPWPSQSGGNYATISLSALVSSGYLVTGRWECTLIEKPLDLLLLIDTTGSMSSAFTGVVDDAANIIAAVNSDFPDYRIAVADFKDDPDYDGDPSDYVYQADVPFTTDTNAVINTIAGFYAEGGGDIPEASYSALTNGIEANGITPWRTGDVERVIVLITDAPGHDPEMWPNGTNSGAVIALANNPALPIHIDPLIVDDDDAPLYPQAVQMGDLLAASTGGISIDSTDASLDGGALVQAIVATGSNPRFPQGSTGAIYPQFTLASAAPLGMENQPARITLEVQKLNSRNRWVPFQNITVSGSEQSTQLRGPVPIGTYQWRLADYYRASEIVTPDGGILDKIRAHTTVEANYTEFMRVQALPEPPTIIAPYALGFTATSRVVTYEWGAGPGATAYALEIFQDGRLFRRLTVKPPKNDPTEGTLMVNVGGHKIGREYSWQIQSLNYDHPKPVNGEYTTDEIPAAALASNYKGQVPAGVNLKPKPQAPSAPVEVETVADSDAGDDTSGLLVAALETSAHPDLVARAQYATLRTPEEKVDYLSQLAGTSVPPSVLPFLEQIINGDPSPDARAEALSAAASADAGDAIVPVIEAAMGPQQDVDLRLQALQVAASAAPSLVQRHLDDADPDVRSAAEFITSDKPAK